MMLSTKPESGITSVAASSSSSPSRSSKRTFYYVQSPSRDSSMSVIQPSPMDSPSHDSSSLCRHSRNSSASRFSGLFRSSSSGRKNDKKFKSNEKEWHECNKVIVEEGSYDELDDVTSIRRCQILLAVFTLVVLFAFFCFIIWGASRPYKTQISVKTFELHNFYVGEGSDFTGVRTTLLTINGTLRIGIYNPAPLFGVHVSSTPINLFFYKLLIATGQSKEHHQLKKTGIMESVVIEGRRIPLYGAGASLEATERGGKIPVKLRFEVQSRGDVVGKLVRIWHTKRISCTYVIDVASNKPIQFNESSCRYS